MVERGKRFGSDTPEYTAAKAELDATASGAGGSSGASAKSKRPLSRASGPEPKRGARRDDDDLMRQIAVAEDAWVASVRAQGTRLNAAEELLVRSKAEAFVRM